MIGACLLAFVGAGIGLLYGELFSLFLINVLYLLSFGGAIAGVISGTKPAKIVAAVIGLIVSALLIWYARLLLGPDLSRLLALLLPSLSGPASAYITKRKA